MTADYENENSIAGSLVIALTFFLIIASIFFVMQVHKPAEPEHSVYPLTAQVVEVNQENDLVACVDGAGNVWEFYGAEDWQMGDFASLLMDDNGTPETIYDDIITMAQYAGIFEG